MAFPALVGSDGSNQRDRMRCAAFAITIFLAGLTLLRGVGHSEQARRQTDSARAALLSLQSPGLSEEQRKYLGGEIAENGIPRRRAKRKGTFIYGVGPKGVILDGHLVAFHDKRDFTMFFWDPQLKLDRKRDCLVPKNQPEGGAKCIPESRGRAVAYDEIWEDVPPSDSSGPWERSYWKDGEFVVAVVFENDNLTMVFERDWCVVAGRCKGAR